MEVNGQLIIIALMAKENDNEVVLNKYTAYNGGMLTN
jgi:hypothetical protein